MNLYRLKIIPTSSWRTPWQADTLTGLLLETCVKVHGEKVLKEKLIEPMRAGRPPFVVSDACPGDCLPMPVWLRAADWQNDASRKAIKRARWLSKDVFNTVRSGVKPPFEQLLPDAVFFSDSVEHHNTLSRLNDTTGEGDSGLAPFSQSATALASGLSEQAFLSLYVRVSEDSAADLFLDLMDELSRSGFGADVTTGRGQFDITGELEPAGDLTAPIEKANGVLCLSTFQPGADDPTEGLWEAFAKFGKLSSNLGVPDARKNTLVLFRPGSCFKIDEPVEFLGRALPMDELLPADSADHLKQRGVDIIHPAFGLTIPIYFEL